MMSIEVGVRLETHCIMTWTCPDCGAVIEWTVWPKQSRYRLDILQRFYLVECECGSVWEVRLVKESMQIRRARPNRRGHWSQVVPLPPDPVDVLLNDYGIEDPAVREAFKFYERTGKKGPEWVRQLRERLKTLPQPESAAEVTP